MNRRQISLNDEEYSELISGWKNGKTHSFRSRCNMVLLNYQGYNLEEIGAMEGVRRQAVGGWLTRYEQKGIEGLHTAKGQGRPPIVRHDNKEVVDKIEALVEEDPQKLERALERIEQSTGHKMSKKTLKRLLKKKGGAGSASGRACPSGRRRK